MRFNELILFCDISGKDIKPWFEFSRLISPTSFLSPDVSMQHWNKRNDMYIDGILNPQVFLHLLPHPPPTPTPDLLWEILEEGDLLVFILGHLHAFHGVEVPF